MFTNTNELHFNNKTDNDKHMEDDSRASANISVLSGKDILKFISTILQIIKFLFSHDKETVMKILMVPYINNETEKDHIHKRMKLYGKILSSNIPLILPNCNVSHNGEVIVIKEKQSVND